MPKRSKKRYDKENHEKVSSRYACMYTPSVTGWEFYDAFCSSAATTIAQEYEHVSTSEDHLIKYMRLAKKQEIERLRKQRMQNERQLPTYLQKILKCQSENGAFKELAPLLEICEMPSSSFQDSSIELEIEQATSLAVAVMRQHIDYFELLQSAHDKAMEWITNKMIYEAREIIIQYTGTVPKESTENNSTQSTDSFVRKINAKTSTSTTANNNPTTLTDDNNEEDPTAVSSSPTNNQFTTQLQVDEQQVKLQREKLQKIEIQILELYHQIEKLIIDIIDCLTRCVQAYNTCELYVDRYTVFAELTARLGEGFLGSTAYEDWRREGVPSYRSAVIQFLIMIQKMAEERLYLAELLQPKGRNWKEKIIHKYTRKRWSLIFNGHNIVLKVLHG
jgi:hypothetical protein